MNKKQWDELVALIRTEAHVEAYKDVGNYLADLKKHGHLNSLTIEAVMERLQKGEAVRE